MFFITRIRLRMSKIFMFPIKYDRAAAETFRVEPTFFMRMRPRRSTSRLAQNNFDIFRRLRWSSVRDLVSLKFGLVP